MGNIIFGFAIFAISIATYFYTERLTKEKEFIAKAEIAKANQAAGQANLAASEANNSSLQASKKIKELQIALAKLEIELSEAKTKQASAELALIRIAKDRLPRTLTEKQKIVISKIMSETQLPKEEKLVQVTWSLGDIESQIYSSEFVKLFEDSGWKVVKHSGAPFDNPVVGIHLSIPRDKKDLSHASALIFRNLLNEIKLRYSEDFIKTIDGNYTINFIVGSKFVSN